MVQLALAASELGHLLVWEKELALVPVMATLDSGNAPVPVLVAVMVCAVLDVPVFCEVKVRLVGLRPSVSVVLVTEIPKLCDELASHAPVGASSTPTSGGRNQKERFMFVSLLRRDDGDVLQRAAGR